jgi:hypothetical protein
MAAAMPGMERVVVELEPLILDRASVRSTTTS